MGGGVDGTSSAATMAATATRGRTHNPPMELPSSNARDFFEEAQIGETETSETQRKFDKFCTRTAAEGHDDDAFLTFESFCRLLQYYESSPPQYYEAYFHAMDRNRDNKLTFKEFLLGVCAADPSTTHILNSYTGMERSRFIFDFYDLDRNDLLDFEEFARLNADCLQIRTEVNAEARLQAEEKARELGILTDGEGGQPNFGSVRQEDLLRFIQNEKMRGTSRLFRLQKSILRPRGSQHSRRHGASSTAVGESQGGSRGHGSSDYSHLLSRESFSDGEDCEWHATLLDLDAGEDAPQDPPALPTPPPPPYAAVLPPAPQSPPVQPEPSPEEEAREVARRVLRSLCSPTFEGLLPFGACCASAEDASSSMPFTAATPQQLRSLCSAVVRILEAEEMVLEGLQSPIKVFGSLHGQLVDLLSHFKWHQAPVEEGDMLYTTYVFTGNYCDRGHFSLEVLLVVLSMKVLYPQRVVLLRGQHENRHLNYHLGLRQECDQRLGSADAVLAYEYLNWVFEHMSLAAVLEGNILALGPGTIPPSLQRLEQLRRYRKPLSVPHALQQAQPDGLLVDLFTPSPLIASDAALGWEHFHQFVAQHEIGTVVSGRILTGRGFSFDQGGRLVGLTSCVNYLDGPEGNDAAILCITKEGHPSQTLRLRARTITGRTARLYRLLGKAAPWGRAAHRWPPQARAATPGRRAGEASVGACLLVHPESGGTQVQPDEQPAFPAFGPGRPPTKGREHCLTAQPTPARSGDSPPARDGGQSFVSTVSGPEDWRHSSGRSPGGVPGTPSRSSAGGTAVRSQFGPPRRTTGGHQPGDGSDAEGHRIQGLRTPGGSVAAVSAAVGSPGGARGTGHRRGVASPSSETSRFAGGVSLAAAAGASAAGGTRAAGRGSSGSHREAQAQGAQPHSRGPSRTPGNPPHPKGASTPSGGTGLRRPSGDSRPPDMAGSRPGTGDSVDAVRSLEHLLRGSPALATKALPAAPAQFLQTARAPEAPLLSHLCRMWVEAGLSDREWGEALQMFERDLSEQPQQKGRLLGSGEEGEGRWTLETFSMWLLKYGRKLKECQTWFDAFDLDRDGYVGIGDFLQGLAATSARKQLDPANARGTCAAAVFHRLLSIHNQPLDAKQLELFCQVSDSDRLQQLAHRANADFDFFCTSVFPLLNRAPFRLRLFVLTPM